MPPADLPELTEYVPPPRIGPCVYFLFDGDEIVYVGQSIDLQNRLRGHEFKTFDRVAYYLVPEDRIDEEERRWIFGLRPKYNAQPTTAEMLKNDPLRRWRTPAVDDRLRELAASDDPALPLEDRPITALGLTLRTVSLLALNGYRTVGEVVAAGLASHCGITNFGPTSLRDLRSRLRAFGIEPVWESAKPNAVAASSSTKL